MIKKIICIGVVLVMCLGFFTGCGNKNDIWYNVVIESNSSMFFPNEGFLQIVNTVEELNTVCRERYTREINADGQEVAINYYLEDMTKNYDEAYFSDKALILYLFSESNGGNSTKITSIEKVEDTIILNITHFVPKGESPLVIVHWTYIIEVNKSDVLNTTKIEKKIKTKEIK